MNKTIGYFIATIGVIGLAVTAEEVRLALGLVLPEGVSSTTVTIISIVMIGIGGLLAFKGSSSTTQTAEVPIYQGNKIVGYRRN